MHLDDGESDSHKVTTWQQVDSDQSNLHKDDETKMSTANLQVAFAALINTNALGCCHTHSLQSI